MLQPKHNIDKLAPSKHGGIDHRELSSIGISAADVLDFSVSTNPFGPPPQIKEALQNSSIENYPDSESTELVKCLAEKLNLIPDNLIIGSGSTELIRLFALAYFGDKDTVLIPKHTYGEYEVACNIAGARMVRQPMHPEAHFKIDAGMTINLLKRHQPKGIFLCNPNNPTGQFLSQEEIRTIVAAAPQSLVILDEAYIAFTEGVRSCSDLIGNGNLIILRSMTKDYALAGLRLGYALSSEPVISVLKRIKPPWNVSSVAQNAGILALNSDRYLKECGGKIREAKEFLIKELTALDFLVVPSCTNFFLVEVGDAFQFRQALLGKGIMVRDCTSFDLPHHIRLAPRTIPECQRLITAVKEVFHHAG